MSDQEKQQQFGNEDKEEDIHSMEGSEWSVEEENIVGHGNAKQKEEESNPKIALLEAKNQILESKLENLELKAQIRALKEEANLNKLKEENQAIRARMEAAEDKANKVEETIQEKAIQYEEQLKGHMQDLEAKNLKEMANLKELLKSQGINLDQIKSNIPCWTDLLKGKKLANPADGNRWKEEENPTDTGIQISADRLNVTIDKDEWRYVFAEAEFCLSDKYCRGDHFSGIIIYYFEAKMLSNPSDWQICVGLSNGNIPDESCATNSPNCYALFAGDDWCFLSGKIHDFKWPNDTIKPKWIGPEDVIGCGILMSPEPANKVSIFFTLNGILLGKKIPIFYPGDRLFPTVRLCDASVEANFGNNSAKPFRYDIDKCPGLEME